MKTELPPSWINKFGDRIDIDSKFVYEMTAYKIFPKEKRAELKSSKFITSEREQNSQVKVEYYPNKKNPDYVIVKSLEMVSAPKWYINYTPLPEFKYIWNKKTKKKK